MLKTKINRANLFNVTLIEWLILFAAGCSQIGTPRTPSPAIPLDETQVIVTLPTEGDTNPMTSFPPTPVDHSLQNLIEKAKEDLGQRLSISPVQINLMEMTEVEWSDSSLGCPQPGMDYLQVITPGYRILLEAGEQEYEYHSNKDNYVLYCESSIPPIPPKP